MSDAFGPRFLNRLSSATYSHHPSDGSVRWINALREPLGISGAPSASASVDKAGGRIQAAGSGIARREAQKFDDSAAVAFLRIDEVHLCAAWKIGCRLSQKAYKRLIGPNWFPYPT